MLHCEVLQLPHILLAVDMAGVACQLGIGVCVCV